MMLQLFMIKEMIIEFILGIWVRIKPWMKLIMPVEAKKLDFCKVQKKS